MGVGGKLLRAQLANGLARGPLAAQQTELDFLKQRLARDFAIDQIRAQGDVSRENTVFGENVGAVEDPSRAAELGVDPSVARRNLAEREALEAQSAATQANARVAVETAGARIQQSEIATEQALANLGLTDLRAEDLRIRNDFNEAQYEQFLRMAPLLEESQRLTNMLQQTNLDLAPLRAAQEQVLLQLNRARKGELESQAAFNRARAATAQLEAAILASAPAGVAGMSPEDRVRMANLANSTITRAQSTMEDFSGLLQQAIGGNEAAVDSLLAQTDLDVQTARKIRQTLLEFDPEGVGFFSGLMSDPQAPLAEQLVARDVAPSPAQAMQVLRDSFLRNQGVSPRAVQNARTFMDSVFSQGQVGADPSVGVPGLLDAFGNLSPENQRSFLEELQRRRQGAQ